MTGNTGNMHLDTVFRDWQHHTMGTWLNKCHTSAKVTQRVHLAFARRAC